LIESSQHADHVTVTIQTKLQLLIHIPASPKRLQHTNRQ
jgi:hypothetical protein